MNVLFLMKSISRSSGGMSSMLDLAETVYALGFNVKIGLINGHLNYLLQGEEKCSSIIPSKNLLTVPSSFESIGSRKSIGGIKNNIKNVLFKIGERANYFMDILKSSDLIIGGSNLTGQAFSELRKETNASIIGNHAGSPKAFSKYWIEDDHLTSFIEGDLNRYKVWCERFDGLLFQSSDQAQECIQLEALPESRCHVIKPSCEEDKVLASKQLGNPYNRTRRIVACIGSLQERKAQDTALKTFSIVAEKHSGVELHFVGGGVNTEYGQLLLQLVKKNHLENRVFFHGHRTDYLRFMAHADMLIQTSKEEGVSRILRESMLMKIPIVSFSISGTSSILKNGKDALLVEPGNTEEMARAIEIILTNSDYANKLTKSAFNRYLLNHSKACYMSNVRKFINKFE